MAIKYILTLNKNRPPHIPIEKFITLVEKDDYLLPETKAILMALRKARQPYVPLPLAHEVIISPEFLTTLHRDTNPTAKIWTQMNWSEKNIKEFNDKPKQFYKDILKLYIEDLGFDSQTTNASKEEVEEILLDLKKRTSKMLKKLEKLGKK